MKKVLGAVAAGVLSLVIAMPSSVAQPASARNGNHFLFQPDASPRGKTLAQWQAAYQIWANEIPTPLNPRTDLTSPLNCAPQDRNVVFLGGFGADCRISDDTAVAFTPGLAFWECSTGEGLGQSFAELRDCARGNFAHDLGPDVYHQSIWIDGQRLRDQRSWVVLTPGEKFTFPTDNVWGAVPGPTKSVTKGFMFVLRPLSEGVHQIRWVLHHDVFGDFEAAWKLRVHD